MIAPHYEDAGLRLWHGPNMEILPRAAMSRIRTNPPRPGRSNWNLEEAVGNTGEPVGYLNPRWIEWLMGFPVGWASPSSTPSETPSSRPSSSTSDAE